MKNIFLMFLLTAVCGFATAQDQSKKKYAIVASLGQQVEGFNFDVGALQTIDATPFKPRVEVGIERTWKEKRYTRFHQDLKLTFVNDPYVERVYGIGTDLGLEFKILKRILLTPRLGVHYNQSKPSDIQYVYENEKWVPTSNYNKSFHRVFIKTGVDLGYRINKKYDVFANGQYSVNVPHYKGLLPVNLNKAASVGVRYSF